MFSILSRHCLDRGRPLDRERLCDGREEQLGIGDGREVDERDAAAGLRAQRFGGGECEPCLSRAARPSSVSSRASVRSSATTEAISRRRPTSGVAGAGSPGPPRWWSRGLERRVVAQDRALELLQLR